MVQPAVSGGVTGMIFCSNQSVDLAALTAAEAVAAAAVSVGVP